MSSMTIFPGLRIGVGCDSTVAKTYGWGIVFEPPQPLESSTGQEAEFNLKLIENSRELAQSLDISASVSVSHLSFGGSAKARYISRL